MTEPGPIQLLRHIVGEGLPRLMLGSGPAGEEPDEREPAPRAGRTRTAPERALRSMLFMHRGTLTRSPLRWASSTVGMRPGRRVQSPRPPIGAASGGASAGPTEGAPRKVGRQRPLTSSPGPETGTVDGGSRIACSGVLCGGQGPRSGVVRRRSGTRVLRGERARPRRSARAHGAPSAPVGGVGSRRVRPAIPWVAGPPGTAAVSVARRRTSSAHHCRSRSRCSP